MIERINLLRFRWPIKVDKGYNYNEKIRFDKRFKHKLLAWTIVLIVLLNPGSIAAVEGERAEFIRVEPLFASDLAPAAVTAVDDADDLPIFKLDSEVSGQNVHSEFRIQTIVAEPHASAWFNEHTSGYNDPTVNGDRNLFDEPATDLNMAMCGNLYFRFDTGAGNFNADAANLKADPALGPMPLEIVFEGVYIGRAEEDSDRPYWLGQDRGQHSRDADSTVSLLLVGQTNSGNQVYASVSLSADSPRQLDMKYIVMQGEGRLKNKEINDVVGSFNMLKSEGLAMNLFNLNKSYDPVVNHVQGLGKWQSPSGPEWFLLNHSVKSAPYAHILAGKLPVLPDLGNENGKSFNYGFKTFQKDWRHPGGFQVLGDYALMPSEQSTTGVISLYDLRSLEVGELKRVEEFNINTSHKVGALGITYYEDGFGKGQYLMVAAHLDGANSIYHVYLADADPGLAKARFHEVAGIPLSKDFQGFGLLTEAGTSKVYMIGLLSVNEFLTFGDYAYLYELDTANWQLLPQNNVHFKSVNSLPGVMGVHFRYGAGISLEDGRLAIVASERNLIVGKSFSWNQWD